MSSPNMQYPAAPAQNINWTAAAPRPNTSTIVPAQTTAQGIRSYFNIQEVTEAPNAAGTTGNDGTGGRRG